VVERSRGLAAVAVMVIVAAFALGVGMRPVAGQAPATSVPSGDPASTGVASTAAAVGTDFPRPLVAPVGTTGQPPELSIDSFYADSDDKSGSVVFAVQFAGPFSEPSDSFRASVVVGDPLGSRSRASYVSVDGRGAGRVEQGVVQGDEVIWQDAGPTTASFDPSGLALITVPVNTISTGTGVWVEAAAGAYPSVQAVVSPVFSYDLLVGRGPEGTLAAGPWATITPGRAGPTVSVYTPGSDKPTYQRLAGPGPTMSLINRGLTLTTSERPPAQVSGARVTQAVDYVRLAGGANQVAGGQLASISVDRTNGSVQLLDASGAPVSGGGQPWLVQGLPPGDPAAPTTLTFDLEAVAAALGLPIGPTTTALGVERVMQLDGGRVAASPAVLGTTAWFDAASVGDGAATLDTATTTSSRRPVVLAAAALVAVLLIVLVVGLVLRRRRSVRRRRELDEWDFVHPEGEPVPAAAPAARSTRVLAAGRLVEAEPVVEQVPVPAPVVEPAPPAAAPEPPVPEPPAPELIVEPEPPVPEPPAPELIVESVPESAPVGPPRRPRSPAEALAALEAELDELGARVDRLGDGSD